MRTTFWIAPVTEKRSTTFFSSQSIGRFSTHSEVARSKLGNNLRIVGWNSFVVLRHSKGLIIRVSSIIV